MRIAVGSDHAGYRLKTEVCRLLTEDGHEVMDLGTHSLESVDYPDYAALVGHAVTHGDAELGVLVCGTGAGMSIAANKICGVRACVMSDTATARLTRSHNNTNVLCLGERIVGTELAADIVRAFVTTPFSGDPRHERRIDLITRLDEGATR